MRVWLRYLPVNYAMAFALAVTGAGCSAGEGSGTTSARVPDNSSIKAVLSVPPQPVGTPVVILPAQPGVVGSRPGPAFSPPPPPPEDDLAGKLGGDGQAVVAAAAKTKPAKFEVDLVGRRVYVPKWGWMDEQQFWELYHNVPQDLPPDLDFEALHKLGFPAGAGGGE